MKPFICQQVLLTGFRLEQQVYNVVKMFKKVRIDDLKSKNDIKIEHVNPGWCWKMDNAPVDETSKSVTAPFKTSV